MTLEIGESSAAMVQRISVSLRGDPGSYRSEIPGDEVARNGIASDRVDLLSSIKLIMSRRNGVQGY